MITCISDNLLVKNIPHEVSGKIYIPPQFRKKMMFLQQGKVISAGKGTDLLPMQVKAGNTVVYERDAGFDIDLKGETYRVLKNYQIITGG